MLVLSRKAGQKVHIGDNIVVEIRRVAGNRVTIALDAPRDVRILRGELQQAATEFDGDDSQELSGGVRSGLNQVGSALTFRELVG